MYKISAAQSKAGRAYLEWSQDDLAKAADVSISTVRSFENGFVPRASSLNQIRKTLESAGIEFTDDDGIRRRNDEVRIYRGANGCEAFFDNMMQEIQAKGGEVFALIKSPDMLMKSCGASCGTSLERLEQMHKTTGVKCLLSDTNVPSFLTTTFPIRTIPQQIHGPSSFFVFGEKIAVMYRDNRMNFIFTAFSITSLTQDYRTHFLSLWGNALPFRAQTDSDEQRARVAVQA